MRSWGVVNDDCYALTTTAEHASRKRCASQSGDNFDVAVRRIFKSWFSSADFRGANDKFTAGQRLKMQVTAQENLIFVFIYSYELFAMAKGSAEAAAVPSSHALLGARVLTHLRRRKLAR